MKTMDHAFAAPKYSWWQQTPAILALIFIIPLAIVVKLITTPFERPANLSADEVADHLRDFLDGAGDDYDWDDFISIPTADPALESIRSRAAQLTMADGDLAKLKSLLAEAEALRVGHPNQR
ncbi:hypothetical protein [Sphingomonas sp.]|uniref:hypothetical protein n=1 Tax=Sphingomonas sp. TaxID=28214 RepID=UPI003D6DA0BF